MRVYVSLTREDLAALGELASAAWRPPRDHASWLLSRAIQQERARKARRLNHTGAPQREQEVDCVAS